MSCLRNSTVQREIGQCTFCQGDQPWAAAEMFEWGGASPKKAPHKDKYGPQIEKTWQKGYHKEKNIAKKAPNKGKNRKKALHVAKFFYDLCGEGRRPALAPRPAGAHGTNFCSVARGGEEESDFRILPSLLIF